MDNKEYYKKKIYSIGGARKKAILGFVKKEKAVILDIGCGDGSLAEILKSQKESIVYGIDISSESLKIAQTKMQEVYNCDLSKDDFPLELSKKKYDYIIISEVLEHLLEPEKMISKVKKIVDNDTELIITVPNVLFWKNRLRILFGKFDYEETGLMDSGHIHFFSWKSFNNLLIDSGYEMVFVDNHIPTRFTKIFGRLFPGLFSYQFIVKAKIYE